jgi:hypothetical protein
VFSSRPELPFRYGEQLRIQGDLGGKVNILVGDSTGHCEKKVHMNMCQILNGY